MGKYTFNVRGMHCASCVMLIESETTNLPGVTWVKSSLADRKLEVVVDFGDRKMQDFTDELSRILRPHGYELAPEGNSHVAKWDDFKVAAPVAIVIIALFVGLQKLGLVDIVNSDDVGYGTSFVIGIIASLSTCMAVVGGLALSLSANYAKANDSIHPQVMFHVGRLVSFFFLGGLIGLFGSVFQLGTTGMTVINFIVAAVLLALGVNMLDVFPWAKRLQPVIPISIGKRAHGIRNVSHTLTPLLVGVSTFFLPCGFTQSMQIYTLTTDSFLTGAMTMLSFAVGTLPVLALLSFSPLGVRGKMPSGIFFKVAGLVVIFFGLFSLVNALVASGFVPPLFSL